MKFILVALLLGLCVCQHPLLAFDPEFKELSKAFEEKETSFAFSIAMKIYVSTTNLYEEMNLKQPSHLTSIPSDCYEILSEIKELGDHPEWVNNFQQIYSRLKKLSSSCTNLDFHSITHRQYKNVAGGSGLSCAICVILVQVLENYVKIHHKDVTDFIQREFCDHFDGTIRPTCEAFVHFAGPSIINALLKRESADVVCLGIGLCSNPQCRIQAGWFEEQLMSTQQPSKIAPWDWLVHLIVDRFGNSHLPVFDLDNDTFSDISTLRGYHWKGADCDELNRHIYPGRKEGSKIIDHDCNGIWGLDAKKGKSFEEQFCSESKRFGVAVIGDSAGAHFSIPEKYFNASMIHKGTFNDLLLRAADELDIPHESGYTGNVNTQGYTRHSVYKYVRQWNLCNNNDYQNIAVNGGDSGNTWGNIKALKRDQKNDNPLLMFLELVGNDVCAKSFNSMTTPEKFKKNILKLLNYLDDTVPKDSHLIIFGLADGEFLFNTLQDAIHPLNVTYPNVYDFLNCLEISPCWGWLNTNQTVRKFTTERAQNLSKIYKEIIDEGTTFKNFDIAYYDFPIEEILHRKLMEGGDPKDLIERCDGFHPNGEFHSYLSDWLWRKIQDEHPDWIGPKNPHNEEIRKMFNLGVLK